MYAYILPSRIRRHGRGDDVDGLPNDALVGPLVEPRRQWGALAHPTGILSRAATDPIHPHPTLRAGGARGPVRLELERSSGRDGTAVGGEGYDDRYYYHDGQEDKEGGADDPSMLGQRAAMLSLEVEDALVDDALIDEEEGGRVVRRASTGTAVVLGQGVGDQCRGEGALIGRRTAAIAVVWDQRGRDDVHDVVSSGPNASIDWSGRRRQ